MSGNRFDADALIDANLPLLGMTLDDATRASVKANLETAERLSRLVRDFALDDEAEPAPVFRA
jgi:hypothetical protein